MTPTSHSFYRRSSGQLAGMLLMALLLPAVPGFAVDRLQIIVENDIEKPGQAKVYFPHLRQWIISTATGLVRLPAPHEKRDVIRVLPVREDIYGPEFTRVFPVEDGIVSLRAIPVTAAIRARAFALQSANRPAEAATAFALTARRIEITNQSEAEKNQRMAYESLAKKYGVSPAYVGDGSTLRASPQLVAAINGKLGRSVVRLDGRFTVDDFKKAAEMKSLSTLVAATQDKFFDKR